MKAAAIFIGFVILAAALVIAAERTVANFIEWDQEARQTYEEERQRTTAEILAQAHEDATQHLAMLKAVERFRTTQMKAQMAAERAQRHPADDCQEDQDWRTVHWQTEGAYDMDNGTRLCVNVDGETP